MVVVCVARKSTCPPFRKLTIVDQLVECNVLHGVVATTPSPKIEFVNCSGGRDPRISKLNMVTLGILAEIVSRALANSQIDWDAIDGLE